MVMPFMYQYLSIPNVSKAFDPNWEQNKYQEQAIKCLKEFYSNLGIKGVTIKEDKVPGKTPIIMFKAKSNVEGCDKTTLLYGHLDK